ncbi:MAG: hypothetical protein KKF62_10580 [Bacteroidetes bacterium]|nr:hypothetical protein [Bacteroidota bacterium]MBU1113512.1 hypothetical protein [Bacteroidota bacterium]MBU1797038.1 hypothetical protein [Bacteroidota bacterium]
MKTFVNVKSVITLLLFSIIISGCSALKTLDNITKLQFKIDSISDFEVQEIAINAKSQLCDFSPSEILKLVQAFNQEKLIASFTLNIDVQNPNASENNSNNLNLEIVEFPWEFYFNDKSILSGNISEPIKLSSIEAQDKIGLQIYFNLFDVISNNNMNELLKTSLELGGQHSSTNKVSLFAKPVIGTFIGNITYPDKIKIVDYEFR